MLQFRIGNGRPHDGIPLIALPRRRRTPDIEDVIAEMVSKGGLVIEKMTGSDIRQLAAKRLESGKNLPELQDYYKYNLGRATFKIRSDETFGIDVTWGRVPVVHEPIRLTAVIEGLKWMPI